MKLLILFFLDFFNTKKVLQINSEHIYSKFFIVIFKDYFHSNITSIKDRNGKQLYLYNEKKFFINYNHFTRKLKYEE